MSSPRSSLDLTPKPLRRKSRLSIHALLEQTLHIRTNDGRVFIGTFICTDKPSSQSESLSMASSQTRTPTQTRAQGQRPRYPPPPTLNPNALPKGRYVGMVLIPFRLILSIHSQVTLPSVPTLNPLGRRSRDQLGQRDGTVTRARDGANTGVGVGAANESAAYDDVDEDGFEMVSDDLMDLDLDDDIRDSIYI